MPSANTPYPCATRNCSPYTDEYHVTSSDFTNKMTKSVMRMTYSKIDGPERFSNRVRHLSKLASVPAVGSWSRCTDQWFKIVITNAIKPSTITACTTAPVGLSIACLELAVNCCSCVMKPFLYAHNVADAFGYFAH